MGGGQQQGPHQVQREGAVRRHCDGRDRRDDTSPQPQHGHESGAHAALHRGVPARLRAQSVRLRPVLPQRVRNHAV